MQSTQLLYILLWHTHEKLQKIRFILPPPLLLSIGPSTENSLRQYVAFHLLKRQLDISSTIGITLNFSNKNAFLLFILLYITWRNSGDVTVIASPLPYHRRTGLTRGWHKHKLMHFFSCDSYIMRYRILNLFLLHLILLF